MTTPDPIATRCATLAALVGPGAKVTAGRGIKCYWVGIKCYWVEINGQRFHADTQDAAFIVAEGFVRERKRAATEGSVR